MASFRPVIETATVSLDKEEAAGTSACPFQI
jgi:hypothetical protein